MIVAAMYVDAQAQCIRQMPWDCRMDAPSHAVTVHRTIPVVSCAKCVGLASSTVLSPTILNIVKALDAESRTMHVFRHVS